MATTGGVNIYYDAWEQLCNICIINLFAGMHNTSWEVIYSIYYLNIMYNTHTNKPLPPLFTMSHYGHWVGPSICVTGAGVTMYICITADLRPPLLSVSDRVNPVGDAPQVPVNEVTPMKGCSSCRSTPATGSAPQELSLERLVGILWTWPNHWRHLCLSCSSTGTILVLSRMSVFWTWFHKVIPRMSGRQCI